MQESGGEAPSLQRPASASQRVDGRAQLSEQQLQELAQVKEWVLHRPTAEVRRLGPGGTSAETLAAVLGCIILLLIYTLRNPAPLLPSAAGARGGCHGPLRRRPLLRPGRLLCHPAAGGGHPGAPVPCCAGPVLLMLPGFGTGSSAHLLTL